MHDTTRKIALLKRTLATFLVGGMAIATCYAFVDRPVATLVHTDGLNRDIILKWFTYPPPIIQSWVPAILTVLIIRRCFGPLTRWQKTLLIAGISLLIADQFRESLAYVFGRTWPETWIDNNPSYIDNGVYGFHFFHGGEGYASFPSGHTARTLAVVSITWIAYPRWRWLSILATTAVAAGLIGMNYHFVSDVLAGGLIGGIVGTWAVSWCEIKDDSGSAAP